MAAVLVVDDDAHIREVARFALARAGHAVELAGDGAAAADRIARGGLALVVLDVLMPELDGLTLCRQLRGRVPIVLLSSRGEEADPVVPGRRAQLASAIDNLVANATQFADPGTTVRVAIARSAAAVRITVENHGPPLSAAARARVWDRFYSTRVASGGTGLGLAIVRSVALGHGGAVGVDCAHGVTAFWLKLRAVRS
jgi:signal transduction histidine kinase